MYVYDAHQANNINMSCVTSSENSGLSETKSKNLNLEDNEE